MSTGPCSPPAAGPGGPAPGSGAPSPIRLAFFSGLGSALSAIIWENSAIETVLTSTPKAFLKASATVVVAGSPTSLLIAAISKGLVNDLAFAVGLVTSGAPPGGPPGGGGAPFPPGLFIGA